MTNDHAHFPRGLRSDNMSADFELILPEKEPMKSTQPADGATKAPKLNAHVQPDDHVDSDDEELDDVEETVRERLVGLTEMLPDGAWSFLGQAGRFSYWLARRSLWVVATSVALLALPPFIEQQRLEIEEMQNMQKKQMMLGQGALKQPNQPLTMPPPPSR